MIKKVKGYLLSNFYYLRHQLYLKYCTKIIIGSGCTQQRGWFSTDLPEIDITSVKKCSKFWKGNSKIAFLAEHVWEHLNEDEAHSGAECCYYFLKNNGRLRIAVPDGFHPNQNYIDQVKPNGNGLGSDDHKILYTVENLSKVFVNIGFEVNPLEYWDSQGNFVQKEWNDQWGRIERSAANDSRNTKDNPLTYTSLIIDCVKRK
jgi:predicted SAM-dependent methyltransferase